MTRETKIGLLVGLAFIIVIGILLSDHMTSTTQPQQAKLDEAASNARESVSAPTSSNPQPAPVTNVRQISPANPVLTQAELRAPVQQQQPIVAQHQQPTGVTQVQVGGPAAPQGGSPIAIRQDMPITPQTPQQPVRTPEPIVADGNSGHVGSNLANSSLEEFARGIGEPIVPIGGNNADRGGNHQPTPPAKPTDAPTATAGGQEYVAQAGDSLSRIASRLMGSNSKANRDAIVKANPSLQKNPDVIIEGRKYVIPAAGAARVATATGNEAKPATPARPANGGTASSHKPVPVTDLVEPLPGTSPAAGGGDWYVVKEKDTLWQIAAEQLGTGTAWTQIRDMNQDVLKGRETVQANMRLRLPPRPVASAAN
jgi:nucleoid-associated protein YgaU